MDSEVATRTRNGVGRVTRGQRQPSAAVSAAGRPAISRRGGPTAAPSSPIASHRFTLLVVDACPIFRLGLRAAFQDASDFSVIEDTGDGDLAIAIALRARPSAVILDGQIQGARSGVEVAREIHSRLPGTKLVALSASAKEAQVIAMIEAGVGGYLQKDMAPAEVVDSLRAVLTGRTVFSTQVSSMLSARLANASGGLALTRREVQTLVLLAGGMQNEEIASAMGVTAKAIQLHLTNIYGKLGARNRTEAVVYGARKGLIAIEGR